MMILETVESEPLTVKQIAEKLGHAPSRLYYHVNLLEKHGFLVTVETRMVSNMVEKVYRAASSSLCIAPDLLNFQTDEGKQAINDMFIQTMDTTREDLIRSLQTRYQQLAEGADPHPRGVFVTRDVARISDAQAEEFAERLKALVNEFGAIDSDAADNQAYALTMAFYPSFHFENE